MRRLGGGVSKHVGFMDSNGCCIACSRPLDELYVPPRARRRAGHGSDPDSHSDDAVYDAQTARSPGKPVSTCAAHRRVVYTVQAGQRRHRSRRGSRSASSASSAGSAARLGAGDTRAKAKKSKRHVTIREDASNRSRGSDADSPVLRDGKLPSIKHKTRRDRNGEVLPYTEQSDGKGLTFPKPRASPSPEPQRRSHRLAPIASMRRADNSNSAKPSPGKASDEQLNKLVRASPITATQLSPSAPPVQAAPSTVVAKLANTSSPGKPAPAEKEKEADPEPVFTLDEDDEEILALAGDTPSLRAALLQRKEDEWESTLYWPLPMHALTRADWSRPSASGGGRKSLATRRSKATARAAA